MEKIEEIKKTFGTALILGGLFVVILVIVVCCLLNPQ